MREGAAAAADGWPVRGYRRGLVQSAESTPPVLQSGGTKRRGGRLPRRGCPPAAARGIPSGCRGGRPSVKAAGASGNAAGRSSGAKGCGECSGQHGHRTVGLPTSQPPAGERKRGRRWQWQAGCTFISRGPRTERKRWTQLSPRGRRHQRDTTTEGKNKTKKTTPPRGPGGSWRCARPPARRAASGGRTQTALDQLTGQWGELQHGGEENSGETAILSYVQQDRYRPGR